MTQPALEVENLRLEIPTRRGVIEPVRGVSFTVQPGETFALVGESGSGKTMTCRSILRLLHPPAHITGGAVRFQGRDLLRLSERELETVRGRGIAMVFQDPMTALNPVLTIERQIGEALSDSPSAPVFAGRDGPGSAAQDPAGGATSRPRGVGGWNGAGERRRRIVTLLRQVGIPDAERRLRAYPHQLSGGQRQRVMLAVVLARRPAVLLADEPTTALDVTIQAQILRLLASLQQRLGMALVLVTHDLGVVRQVVHRVAVMYAGQIVETASTAELFARPRHPYTAGLIASVPSVDRNRPLIPIPGVPPDFIHLGEGCAFAPRCPLAAPECRQGEIALRDVAPERLSRCLKAEIVGEPVAV